ncbi:MAG: SRPBCC domain-containing protein [Rhodospirillaceae bacterium]|nr:SRPBCC domain-containing protein [Rhodospirillaceae bacterium]
MKYRHEFRVREPRDRVWLFFEQPLEAAQCMPGVEEAQPLESEDDTYSVRATQKLGPMSTTFQAKVRITERVTGARIAFTATGKAVRGAVGNFRAQNTVTLTETGGETCVAVEGEVALAGVLGTVGSAVINKHAAKVTAEFATNLERALSAADQPCAGLGPEEAAVERR